MDINTAMLQVAAEFAQELGYNKIEDKTLNAVDSEFWGNRVIAAASPLKPVEVTSCKYAPELTLEQVKALNEKRPPKIEIDMFWGAPRLNIDKADGTFACVVYSDGKLSNAQAFGDKGLNLAIDMKNRIDNLLK